MTDLAQMRKAHMAENCLAWVALNHFLPSTLVRELSSVLSGILSAHTITLDDLFEQSVRIDADELTAWAVKPRIVSTPIASYLQQRIRRFVWANDSELSCDPTEASSAEAITQCMVEDAVRFGQSDYGLTVYNLDRMSFTQQSMKCFVAGFRKAQSALHDPEIEGFRVAVAQCCAELGMPLALVATKHLGDLCADADEWGKAEALYGYVLRRLSEGGDQAWTQFLHSFEGIVHQSYASALWMTKGAASADIFLGPRLEGAAISENLLFQLNASQDALVASTVSAESFTFGPDLRASLLNPPLLLKSHSISYALEATAIGKYTDAHKYYWRVLRRQTALGSASESRVTKAYYAKSLFAYLESVLDRDHIPHSFIVAVRLLLESGQADVASKITWTEQFCRAYLTQELIDQLIVHVERNAGVKDERLRVATELFGGWTKVISPDLANLAAYLLNYLAVKAKGRKPRALLGNDEGRRIVETLNEVGGKRPEFRERIASTAADLIVLILRERPYWQIIAEALKTALCFVDAFSQPDLANIVRVNLLLLDGIDPAKGMWPIVQPSLNLLTSSEVKQLSIGDPALARQVFSTIVKFGLHQETEHARLLFYLHGFDVASVQQEPMLDQIHEVVADVRRKARSINSSDAVDNVRALLMAPAIAEKDGVEDALDALARIITSANTERTSISFPYAYEVLLLLAARREEIARAISTGSNNEFSSRLRKILELLPGLWRIAKVNPLIFAPFSLPPATVPNSTIVHNWAFASINFAISLGELPTVVAALEVASEEPALRDAISLARATRLAATEEISPATIEAEDRKTFYSVLGQRLVRVRKVPFDKRRECVEAMLHQCIRQGPHGLDLAIFMLAIEIGMNRFMEMPGYQNYLKRLDSDRDLRLAIAPILRDVEDDLDQS